ncbi:NAD(P)-dependent oxidoreductase [Curvibacter sp. CHRR-16]|uniref:NAD-dependent epimerase/dehydratase family protein n=1 Tax=Curvibacter sp. CHRR-16 TaxID=2835872 RepID=UPI001BDAD6F1|nr:NAD(P)-dependent oxidoreductase [Curvibacter sp. CHRR-16]MBT0570127.1 NAD(P)-dependent oxidoreductase [Curvibacter sp. CHRR-16]
MKVANKLLLTGAAGGLGKVLRETLKPYCDVIRLSDKAAMEPAKAGEEVIQADLANAAEVNAMVEGCDAIIHMGGISVEAPFEAIMQANILGVYNLYEAARKHGVKRVIFASSNHVIGFYKQSETITVDSAPRPDGYYGLSKAYGEDLSRYYFDRYGIETVCLRIGSSFPKPRDRRMLCTYLSYDDLLRLLVASLSAPAVGHSIIYGVSDNPVTWWDNSGARHIGYKPQDSSAVFREEVYANTATPDPKDPAAIYQGGAFVKANP